MKTGSFSVQSNSSVLSGFEPPNWRSTIERLIWSFPTVHVSRPPVPFDASIDGHSLPTPDRRQVGVFIALFLLVGGLGIIQVPVKTNQLTISEERYVTAAWMDDNADEHDWGYPQNYVFSPLSYNRLYNYFVNGESEDPREDGVSN